MVRDVLTRNLPGIPSQRLRRTGRRPVVTEGSTPHLGPVSPIPVSDTYTDGTPEDGSASAVQQDTASGDSGGEEFESYTLTIMGSRRCHFTFSTLDKLKEEVKRYLSPSEIKSGVLDRLTTFDMKKINRDGYVENKWQYYSTCAYPFED